MVHGAQLVLDVRACAELGGRAEKDADFAFAGLFKHGLALRVVLRVMHKGDLMGGNAHPD